MNTTRTLDTASPNPFKEHFHSLPEHDGFFPSVTPVLRTQSFSRLLVCIHKRGIYLSQKTNKANNGSLLYESAHTYPRGVHTNHNRPEDAKNTLFTKWIHLLPEHIPALRKYDIYIRNTWIEDCDSINIATLLYALESSLKTTFSPDQLTELLAPFCDYPSLPEITHILGAHRLLLSASEPLQSIDLISKQTEAFAPTITTQYVCLPHTGIPSHHATSPPRNKVQSELSEAEYARCIERLKNKKGISQPPSTSHLNFHDEQKKFLKEKLHCSTYPTLFIPTYSTPWETRLLIARSHKNLTRHLEACLSAYYKKFGQHLVLIDPAKLRIQAYTSPPLTQQSGDESRYLA